MASDATGLSSASLTTRADAGDGKAGEVSLWLQAIDLAGREEADWRKRGEDAIQLYRGGKRDGNMRARNRRFNILFANTETLAPATYNSLPIPDIRRRFAEADPVSKSAALILERSLSYSMERQDFDGVMQRAVKDALLVGRAVIRVKYKPTIGGSKPSGDDVAAEAGVSDKPDDDANDDDEDGEVLDESTCCETVSWADFRRGPGKVWADVPWIAFRHFLTRDELRKLAPRVGMKMDLDARIPGMDDKTDREGVPPPDLFRRATVWEVWDKEKRRVLFVAAAWPEAPLKDVDDPLGLADFFPIPKPIYAIESPDDLVPVEPYRLYKDLAEELDIITRRITALVSAMKWRGAYIDPNLGDFLTKFKDLRDGEITPLENPAQMLNGGGGLDKAFWFMPIEQVAGVIDRLYAAREQVKQSIYEVTGIADIVRGATKANETATAQQIKSQWGNLRIQRLQAEVGRFARDGLRLEAEIMAEKFGTDTLLEVSGVKLPKQAEVDQQIAQIQQTVQATEQQVMQQLGGRQMSPEEQQKAGQAKQQAEGQMQSLKQTVTQEKVMELLRDDAQRRFRIDIETDSTIRADVQRAQENITGFVTGFGGFIQAIGPAVQQGAMPMKVAAEMIKSFSRAFKLGRSVEDALDEMPTEAPPQADPKAAAAEAEKAKGQAVMQVEQMKLQADQQKTQAQMQADQQKVQGEMQIRAAEAQAAQQGEQAKLQAEAQAAQMQAQVAIQTKQMEIEAQQQIAMAKLQAEAQQHADDIALEREKLMLSAQQAQAEAQSREAQHGEQYNLEREKLGLSGSSPGMLTKMAETLTELAAHAAAPAELVRGPDGRATGIRKRGVERQILRGPDGRATGVQ